MVVMDAEPDRLAPLPRQRHGPPRGLGGGGALLRRHHGEEFRHVQEQACAIQQGAVSSKARSKPAPQELRPQPDASEFEAGAGAGGCCAGRTGPRSPASCNPPAGSRTRCAGSLPAWCARSSGSSSNRRRAKASGSTDRRRQERARARDYRSAASVVMRSRGTEPAAIAAEIDRIRSLPLDAIRRRWQAGVRTQAACGSEQGPAGSHDCARLQERAFGGLDRDSLRFLESLARRGGPPVASSNPAPCWFASIKASATPSRSRATASTGREQHIPASRRSPAPSPAPPGAARGSSPCTRPWRHQA